MSCATARVQDVGETRLVLGVRNGLRMLRRCHWHVRCNPSQYRLAPVHRGQNWRDCGQRHNKGQNSGNVGRSAATSESGDALSRAPERPYMCFGLIVSLCGCSLSGARGHRTSGLHSEGAWSYESCQVCIRDVRVFRTRPVLAARRNAGVRTHPGHGRTLQRVFGRSAQLSPNRRR